MPSSTESRLSKSVTFQPVRDGPGRCRDHRLLDRCDRRAEGRDASASRPTGHRRRVCERSAGYRAGRHHRRHAAARLHLRAWRAGRFSAALRRRVGAAGGWLACDSAERDPHLQGDHLLRRPGGLSAPGSDASPGDGSRFTPRRRLGRRGAPGPDLQRLGGTLRHPLARWIRRHGASPHRDLKPRRRCWQPALRAGR